MTTITELDDFDLLDTMEDYLEKRVIAALATNSTISSLLREVDPFTWTQGEPPKGKLLDTPGGFVWIIRERPSFNANGSLLWHDYEMAIRVSLGNKTGYKPFKMNSDGTYADPLDDKHTALREAHVIRAAMRLVLEEDAFDNNWYLDFVQNGMLGELNRSSINYESFGGADLATNMFVQYLTVTITVRCWSESSVLISKGDLTVTVTDAGVALEGATVTITDHYGNKLWDGSENIQWTTDGSGIASISDVVAQKDVDVTVTKSGVGTRTETGENISNAITTAVTVAFGTNDFEFTTDYANINDSPNWVLTVGDGSTTENDNKLTLNNSGDIYSSAASDTDKEFSVAVASDWTTSNGTQIYMFGTDSSGNETEGTVKLTFTVPDSWEIEEYDGSSWTNQEVGTETVADYTEVVLERSTGVFKLTTGSTAIIPNTSPTYLTAGRYLNVLGDTDPLICDYIRITPIT